MASRQRSFFDQKPSHRHPWQHRRPFTPRQFAETSLATAPSLPPRAITASSQARRKLNNFLYEPEERQMSEQRIHEAEKENAFGAAALASVKGSQGFVEVSKDRSKASPVTSSDRPKDFPQTPVPRVPFADLVDNGTIQRGNSSPVRTPPVHIGWKQSPTSSDSESAWVDYNNRKKRKRARSSSPDQPSSQPSLHIDKTFLMPAVGAAGNLDPTLELEKRLFGDRSNFMLSRGSAVTPCKSRATSSASAELLRSSSPTTPAAALTESAKLRRTKSCGVAFPISGNRKKRRRINSAIDAHDSLTPFDDKLARISALLDKFDDNVFNQAAQQRGPTAKGLGLSVLKGPSPRRRAVNGVKASAILDAADEERQHSRSPSEDEFQPHDANRLSQNVASLSIKKSSSSDFGVDELDCDLFGLVEETNTENPYELCEETAIVEARTVPGPDVEVKPKPQLSEKGDEVCRKKILEKLDDVDDFDDFMNDLLPAELEQIAATYDQTTSIVNQPINHEISKSSTPETIAKHAGRGRKPVLVSDEQVQLTALIDASDEEFGGDDFNDIAEEFSELTQAAEKRATPSNQNPLIPRYVVKEVLSGSYTAANGFTRGEKIVQLQDERTRLPKVVHLREAWIDCLCPVAATVHVIGDFSLGGTLVIDNTQNLLIVHPDHLLSATVVADAFKCTRRAALQDRIKATSAVNESQVFGHILHEVFQECLKANQWDTAWLENVIEMVAARYMENLFELNLPIDRAVQELVNKVQGLSNWAQLFMSTRAKPGAQLSGPKDSAPVVGINKLLDVEEHVWSPLYGLKGNIDATVQVHAPNEAHPSRQLVVPFELKTGRATSNTSHNSQTALYTLLLSDRYDVQIAFGILHYLETNSMIQVLGQRNDIIHMIMKRNELACYARDRTSLPPMLKNEHACGRCYAQSSCFVYHKLVEDGNGKTSGMGAKFKELMGHLDSTHAEFFRKWDDLLTKEERDVSKFRRELWSLLSTSRELVGRCFSEVVIKPGTSVERTDVQKINRFEYVFVKKNANPSFSFSESQINLGEPIVISDEEGHFALANGYVTKIRPNEVSVAVDRQLHDSRSKSAAFDPVENQCFKGIMDVKPGNGKSQLRQSKEPTQTLYRIDKDEFSNGMALVRNNLIRVMEKDLFGSMPLRRLIIEDVAPSFRSLPKGHSSTGTGEASLNSDQIEAIEKVMSANEYALILGMPGTGKTTTISHLIRTLVSRGKSVLLTSYTHTAVDNILLKIRNEKFSILRIGAESKIHPDVPEFADLTCRPKHSFDEIQRSYQSQVVATTCLGINHPIFNQRTFDYCIVDEASQITLPVCLGPIRMAHTFVLVGDHNQLPPLVQNKEAQEGGLDVSLFKLLSDRHPESVVNLKHQYRMCEDIMSLSNTLIYKGMLKCGTLEVTKRQLKIPQLSTLEQHHHSLSTLAPMQGAPCPRPSQATCWLRKALDPANAVIFVNTDPAGHAAREVVAGSRITNPFEVSITTQLVRSLLTVGIDPKNIGVIALYRSQLALLRQSLRNASSALGTHHERDSAIEMHTADKFQGRDKEAIVLSLARSNDKSIVGDLLQDWRRVNVALTRARTKLIIVGSFSTMKKGNPLLEKMCELIEDRKWRMDISRQVLDEHWFNDLGSQSSSKPYKLDSASSPSPEKTSQPRGRKEAIHSPLKRGKGMSPGRILKSRPVLQDIVNGVIG